MFLEIIAQTVVDAKAAEQAGANRIELVQDMQADGLTPAVELIEAICQQTQIAMRVMVRFHNCGFVYTDQERQQICQWVEAQRDLPIEGFVLGGLSETGTIDTDLLDAIATVIGDKKVTFHRAFDHMTWEEQKQAIAVLRCYPFIDTILTSGGLTKPLSDNLPYLVELTQLAAPIQILIGGGVKAPLISQFEKYPQLQALHIGSAAREQQDFTKPLSFEQIQQFKNMQHKGETDETQNSNTTRL